MQVNIVMNSLCEKSCLMRTVHKLCGFSCTAEIGIIPNYILYNCFSYAHVSAMWFCLWEKGTNVLRILGKMGGNSDCSQMDGLIISIENYTFLERWGFPPSKTIVYSACLEAIHLAVFRISHNFLKFISTLVPIFQIQNHMVFSSCSKVFCHYISMEQGIIEGKNDKFPDSWLADWCISMSCPITKVLWTLAMEEKGIYLLQQ